jgi:hypothetical protein
VDLGPGEAATSFMQFAVAQGLALVTDSTAGDHSFVHVFDRASKRWLPATSAPTGLHYIHEQVADALVWVPYHRCAFDALDKTAVLRGNKIVPAPSPLSMRVRPAMAVVGPKLVVWGGSSIAKAPDDKADCKALPGLTPVADGAALDPATGKWNALPAGPPALQDIRSFAAPDNFFVYGIADTKPVFWRYDIRTNAWTELKGTPSVFAGPAPQGGMDNIVAIVDAPTATRAGSIVVLNRGGATPAQDVIDLDAGTVKAGKPLPADSATFVAIDKSHVLAIPRSPVPAKPVAYLQDVATLAWCEMPWIDRAPFYTPAKIPGIAVAKSVADKLVVWLDGAAYGYFATFH